MADIQAEEREKVPQSEPSGDITSSEEVQESGKGEERDIVEPTSEEDVLSMSPKEEQKQVEEEESEVSTAPTAELGGSTESKEADTSLNEEQQQTDQECLPSGEVEGQSDTNEVQTSPLPEEGAKDKADDEVEETPQEEQKPLEEERPTIEPSRGDINDTDKNKSGEEVNTSPTEKDSEIPLEDTSKGNGVDDGGDFKGGGEEEEEGSDDGSFATAEGTEGEEVSGSDEEGGGGPRAKPQRRRRGRQDDSELSEQEDTEGEGEGGEKKEREENGEFILLNLKPFLPTMVCYILGVCLVVISHNLSRSIYLLCLIS